MKNQFIGFYDPNTEDINSTWKEDSTLFVFDTNVLLYLYGYAKNTKKDFFQILEKIPNIWLPYHVGLEYQRNRLNIIRNEKNNFSKVEQYLENINTIFTKNIKELNLEQRHPKLNDNTKILHKEITDSIKKYKKSLSSWDKKQPCVMSTDEIRKRINSLFDKKVGDKPADQKWLNTLYEEGESRYKNKVPPGYEDKKEKEKKPNFSFSNLEYIPMYGDLIIWKQIMEKAKDEHIKSVIFISDDVKEDWLYSINSKGKKEIGARAELRDEIHKNSDINLFTILTTSEFMKKGKLNLNLDVSDESIQETQDNYQREQIRNIELKEYFHNISHSFEDTISKKSKKKTLYALLTNISYLIRENLNNIESIRINYNDFISYTSQYNEVLEQLFITDVIYFQRMQQLLNKISTLLHIIYFEQIRMKRSTIEQEEELKKYSTIFLKLLR